MVLKTMSSNEVKQRWGSVMSTVDVPDDAVIVESHGKPKAAVISFERFEKLRELEKKEQRENALRTLREIEARYDGRNDDLDQEAIEALADRFSREFVDDLVTEGKVVFEHDAAQ
ncbi:MAG: type II toxin-antitoxin system Phd/YefM family antitoxin [Chloroflexota bacterium]|nr:type II toxin-antitoxin system Phd/YefM family antitoxin [Chloroflexota bacterium]